MSRWMLLAMVPALWGCDRACASRPAPPNVLLIVADDLGFSDIAPFGGEIETPALSGLAASGRAMFSFYASPMCSPTRAMLLTGADNHVTGLGVMQRPSPAQAGQPGYETWLNDRVPTIAASLQGAGYQTWAVGKWHLGAEPGRLPGDRGFQRSFVLAEGFSSHFSDAPDVPPTLEGVHFFRDGAPVGALPPDFYASTAFTDELIGYLGERDRDAPFFGLLSFTAPHDPLHAPDAWIERYADRYSDGYEVLRAERLAALQGLGLISDPSQASPLRRRLRPWAALSEHAQRYRSRKMAVYAAMIGHMDHQIGRVLDALEAQGLRDDTLVMFLSDNGAASRDDGPYAGGKDPAKRAQFAAQYDNSVENVGRPGSFASTGVGWAYASTVPFRGFKASLTEGGIRVPFIAAGPGVAAQGADLETVGHVMDIAPTVYAAAGIDAAPEVLGRPMNAYLAGQADTIPREYLAWELHGHRAVRRGDWKIVWEPHGQGWMLFNLRDDPGETIDLAARSPAQLAALEADWADYVAQNGVIVP